MNNLWNMIWIELRKTTRSRIPQLTTLGSLFLPAGIGFLLFIARNPEISRKLGLISAKADLMRVTATDWPSYLTLSAQMIAMAGFFFFCLIISWIFGREFTDGTIIDILAVPVPRASILLAKFIVSALWCSIISCVIFILILLLGALFALPQGTEDTIRQGALVMLITVCLTILIIFPFALLASIGRGYLLPMGAAIITLILANITAIAGWGEYFPWAIPGMYSQALVTTGAPLEPASYWVVILTGLVGMAGTYLWWKNADQSK